MRRNALNFLLTRKCLMDGLGWNRRVATLATRLAYGIDTWEGIASTPSFLRLPLLSQKEVMDIRTAGFELIRDTENWRVVLSETEEVAPSDTGAGSDMHPTFNIKGTQTGRWAG